MFLIQHLSFHCPIFIVQVPSDYLTFLGICIVPDKALFFNCKVLIFF